MTRKLGLVHTNESGPSIRSVRELTDAEYQEYSRAASRLLQYSNDQQHFMIVLLNYIEFENLLEHYLRKYTQDPSINWGAMQWVVMTINRCILNFLSAVRTFLDHSEYNLKKRYGPQSGRVSSFKTACSNAYDNCFSYRFLNKLRNYAQHCGMPLGNLQLVSKLENQTSEKVAHSLAIYFGRDELLTKYDSWGSRLKREIQNLPPKFEITSHVREMVNCLKGINLTLIGDDLPELVESARVVQEFTTPTKQLVGTPCILTLERGTGDNRKKMKVDIEWIPLHLVDMVMKLRPS